VGSRQHSEYSYGVNDEHASIIYLMGSTSAKLMFNLHLSEAA